MRTLALPVSRRYFEPVTVRAAPKKVSSKVQGSGSRFWFRVQGSGSGKQPTLAAGVPEEHRFVLREQAAADVGDEAGHGLGRIRRVEKDRLRAGEEIDRFARCGSRDSVAVA